MSVVKRADRCQNNGSLRAEGEEDAALSSRPDQHRLADLKGTRTHHLLKKAFSRESEAVQLHLFFSRIAEIEGYPALAKKFIELAESQSLCAHGHLDFLRRAGDVLTELPIGDTELNLRVAAARAAVDAQESFPDMARTAHAEGFPDIAGWFETLAAAKQAQADALHSAIQHLEESDD